MKSEQLIEEIKSRIDIVDLVAERVELKRSGQNYKGLCPFHSEKTPSFMVSPSKQIFHCFGCNKGGDMMTFIMNYESMSFQEALSYLSQKAGLKVEEFRGGSPANKNLKEGLLSLQKEASVFFTRTLGASQQAATYLKGRGLSSETIEKFSLGYSPHEKDLLLTHLKKQGFPLEHIRASGLVYFGEGSAHDFFRDRVMFPIGDLQGKVIAFGGRILSSSKNAPKYLNSPDSPVFRKGESLYAQDIAKNVITQKGYALVVEGYLDALICHQHGFGNTVAPLGTALTAGHLRRLKRFSKRVLLVFDGDAAGIAATKRSLELIYSEGMTAKVLLLPEGEDPDTFIRKHGPDYVRKYLGTALTPVRFSLKVFGKNQLDAVRYIVSLVSGCPDPLQREDTIRELSESSKMSELSLREELRTLTERSSRRKRSPGVGQESEREAPSVRAMSETQEEKMLLSIALSVPDRTSDIVRKIDLEAFENGVIRRVFEKMRAAMTRASGGPLRTDELIEACTDEERGLVTSLSIEPEIDHEAVGESVEDCLRRMAIRMIARRIHEAERQGDEKLLLALLHEKNKILSQRTSQNWLASF